MPLHRHSRAALQRLGDVHGDGESDQTQRIIHGDHRQQHFAHRAACLVLTDDHQRSRRRGGGGNGTQRHAHGQIKARYARQRAANQHYVHQNDRAQTLKDRDGQRLGADALEITHLEFGTDGIGDEAQRGFRNDGEAVQHIAGKNAQHRRANDQAAHQKGRHVWQPYQPRQAAHRQPGSDGNGQRQQHVHGFIPSTNSAGTANRMPVSGWSQAAGHPVDYLARHRHLRVIKHHDQGFAAFALRIEQLPQRGKHGKIIATLVDYAHHASAVHDGTAVNAAFQQRLQQFLQALRAVENQCQNLHAITYILSE